MRFRQIALAAVVLLTAVAVQDPAFARKRIEGSGRLETRTLELDAFSAVELGGSFDVTIRFGPEQKVEATLDDNLFDNLEAEVSGQWLKLGWDKDCDADKNCEIAITMVDLEAFALNGVGDVQITEFAGDSLEFDLHGVGDAKIDGKVGKLRVALMGVGDIEARGLKADHVKVELSGVGDCEVFAAESIDARVSGVGDLSYWGDPQQRSTKTSGIGDIDAR